jgi:tyrosine-protein kinase Etk/Wzc
MEPYRVYPDPDASVQSESLLGVILGIAGLFRRHLLLASSCVVIAVGLAVALMYREQPTYRANAVIRFVDKARSVSGGLATSANDQMGFYTDPILSALQVLQSRRSALEIAQREGLQLQTLTRGFTRASMDSVSVASDAPQDTLRATFGSSGVSVRYAGAAAHAPYGQPISIKGVRFIIPARPRQESALFNVVSLNSAADAVAGSLNGRPRERTDVVDVTVEGTDPVLATRTANTAVQVFQAASAQTSRQQSVRRREFVEQQLQKTEALLQEAQAQYSAFRSREQTYSAKDKFKSQASDLTGVELRREELATDRRIYGALLAALDSVSSGKAREEHLTALVSSPAFAGNIVVGQMFSDLLKLRTARDSMTAGAWGAGRNNPDVKRLDGLIASAQANVESAIRSQLATLDLRLAALDELKSKSAKQLATLPTTEAKETDLLAQVQTYQHQAERLRDQLQSAQIDEAADAGQVDVIDFAESASMIGKGRVPRLVFALLIGLALGGAASYVRENYSAVIRKREDIERAVPAPNLAVVPKIKALAASTANGKLKRIASRSNGKTENVAKVPLELVTVNDRRSNSAEAYRTLRTNLLFSAAVQSLRCIVVTSAGPGEGKSTTAANLAVAMAQQGHRVLLVDCDLRKPRVHSLFGIKQEPGLTNVLLGKVSLADAKQSIDVPNLSILSAGPLPPNPVELLGSPAMRQMLASALDIDMIVLDTPPLLVASDASVLGRLSDGVVMVVRAGFTQRGAVKEALHQLLAVNARIIGTVLNDPDSETAKYSTYYDASQYYEFAESN